MSTPDDDELEFETPTEVPVHDFEDPEPIVYEDDDPEPSAGQSQ